MSRLRALAGLLTLAIVLQGCSAVIAWSIENEPRYPLPEITAGTSRDEVGALLGDPEKRAPRAGGGVVVTYKYRVYPPNLYGTPGQAADVFVRSMGLVEILAVPVGLIAKARSFARSTVHRIDVTYDDELVTEAGPWR